MLTNGLHCNTYSNVEAIAVQLYASKTVLRIMCGLAQSAFVSVMDYMHYVVTALMVHSNSSF